jgi:hypothetical protein
MVVAADSSNPFNLVAANAGMGLSFWVVLGFLINNCPCSSANAGVGVSK